MNQFKSPRISSAGLASRGAMSIFSGLMPAVCCLALLVATTAVGQSLTPPPAPAVPPVISSVYPSDLDGNHIDDELEGTLKLATVPSSLYGASNKSLGAALADEQMVDVELIFDAPVIQEQIDAFIALGGEITHMYEVVSYGWNGRVARGRIDALPSAMGSSLVLVTPATRQVQLYMDLGSQLGRVRPVWRPGFAGQVEGFQGNSNTTIGFIDTGVDSEHTDLAGRCVYWTDVTAEAELVPVDGYGHGTKVAGVAVGTGQSAGADASEFRYTYVEDWPYGAHIVDPICLPSGSAVIVSRAWWNGAMAWLEVASWLRGDIEMSGFEWIGDGLEGISGISVTRSFHAVAQKVYSPVLVNFDNQYLDSVVITNSVPDYPGVGDGFNKFSGVAPGCNYAAVKMGARDGRAMEDGFGIGLDRLVSQRISKKIKIVNISGGLSDGLGFPMESTSLRDKVTSAVRNGVIVTAAAGNAADQPLELLRTMADPARAALAITVGASNDENRLTDYSNYGYISPREYASEDFKPDLIAPGGDYYYTTLVTPDSGTSDGLSHLDKVPNDYSTGSGTSFSSPYVAGAAALVIEALERGGLEWDFTSDRHPRLVKMLLCATATETNTNRQGDEHDPSLQRDAAGPEGFPAGKDRYEGYGLINVDAAVEAAGRVYTSGTVVTEELGDETTDRRAWAGKIDLSAGAGIDIALETPDTGDFDLYLYDMVPSDTGTPVLLASSTTDQDGADESISYTPQADASVLLVVKRVSGSGAFTLSSLQAGPPVAQNGSVSAGVGSPVTITLEAVDDGSPNPPGQLTYTIVSLPQHGQLERVGSGSPITSVPATLAQGVNQVVYRPDDGWDAGDSFTFRADDGGVAPYGGLSNVATVTISVVFEQTVAYRVMAGADDAHGSRWGMTQKLSNEALAIGQYIAGMRFTGVEIPQGAEIIEAKLRICAHWSGLNGEVWARLRAEAADDPGEFTNSHRANGLTMTTASQAWNWDSTPWVRDTWYESPDMAAVIQEVVDRPGWSPGNALVIAYVAEDYDGNNRKFWSYEGDPEKAPELVIVYKP